MTKPQVTQQKKVPIETEKLSAIGTPRIYREDFDYMAMTDAARRIAADRKYEETWKRIAENKANLEKA